MTIDRIKIPIMKQDGLEDIDLPAYMSEHASGMDLCAAVGDELIVEPKATLLVPTGIHVAVPAGYEIQIRPRSGLAAKYGIGILNSPGTIDADYRGEIKVILINLGREDFRVTRGMRIAQMVLQRAQRIEWEAVPSLEPTARSEGGFGHTGV